MTTLNIDNDEAASYWERVKPHYSALERSRPYALNADSQRCLAALMKACVEQRGDRPAEELFCEVLEGLRAVGINVLQDAPQQAPKLPALWCDPVTGAALPSPFEIRDQTARHRALAALGKHDPDLLEYFKAMHEDPYGHVQHLRELEAKVILAKAAKYGAAEHSTNVFLHGNASERAAFIHDHPDLAPVYEREARAVSLELSLTQRGQLTKNPRVNAAVTRAREIENGWKAAERRKLHEEEVALKARLAALDEWRQKT